jgi:hypothetical protein
MQTKRRLQRHLIRNHFSFNISSHNFYVTIWKYSELNCNPPKPPIQDVEAAQKVGIKGKEHTATSSQLVFLNHLTWPVLSTQVEGDSGETPGIRGMSSVERNLCVLEQVKLSKFGAIGMTQTIEHLPCNPKA